MGQPARRTAVAKPASGRTLVGGNAVLLVLLVAHTANHALRHKEGIPLQLWAAAGLLYAIVGVALALAVRHDAMAPTASAVAGLSVCSGSLVGHLGPSWALSQSYWQHPPDPLSWVLLASVAAVGLWVGVVGLSAHPSHCQAAGHCRESSTPVTVRSAAAAPSTCRADDFWEVSQHSLERADSRASSQEAAPCRRTSAAGAPSLAHGRDRRVVDENP
jgi:hypothetical protein